MFQVDPQEMCQLTPSGVRPIKWADAIFILRFHLVFSGYTSLEVATRQVHYIIYNSDRYMMSKTHSLQSQ